MIVSLTPATMERLKDLFAQSDDEFHKEILEALEGASLRYEVEVDTEIAEVLQDTIDELF